MMEIKLSPEELESIKDEVRFREQVMIGLKKFESLPCFKHDERMTAAEKTLSAIKTQVYFQWAVLGVILYTIIKGQ